MQALFRLLFVLVLGRGGACAARLDSTAVARRCRSNGVNNLWQGVRQAPGLFDVAKAFTVVVITGLGIRLLSSGSVITPDTPKQGRKIK